MKPSIVDYPRVGALRELKFASEKYFKKEISTDSLQEMGAETNPVLRIWLKRRGK